MTTLQEAFDLLLSRNRSAFDETDFDCAYHLLASALHLAQAMGNSTGLDGICHLANEQGATIDRDHADYKHSTVRAEERGNRSIFAALSQQAHNASFIVRQQATRSKSE